MFELFERILKNLFEFWKIRTFEQSSNFAMPAYIYRWEVQNLFMQVDLLVALLGFLDSKSKKKNRKHLLDHLYNFAVCFFVANQNVGLYGYGFVGF